MSTPHPDVQSPPVVEGADEEKTQRRVLGFFFILMPVVLIYLLFKVFPPIPWPTADPETNALVKDIPIYFLRGTFHVSTSLEERLLLLVMVAGGLGSYIHSATSFSDFVGNEQFKKSWTWWYVLRPFVGVGLALVIYFAVRGGLLLLVVQAEAVSDASKINAFGVAAVAGLTGMFSKQAGDKLAEVFSTLFKSSGDENRKDSLTTGAEPVVKEIDPKSGPIEGGTRVTITGTGFATKAKVFFGDVAATNVEVVNDTTITLDTPPHAAGPVDVRVENSDDKSVTVVGGYTYGEPEDLTSPPFFEGSPPEG